MAQYSSENQSPSNPWEQMLMQNDPQAVALGMAMDDPELQALAAMTPEPNPVPMEVTRQVRQVTPAPQNEMLNLVRQYGLASQDALNQQQSGVDQLSEQVRQAQGSSPSVNWKPLASIFNMNLNAIPDVETPEQRQTRLIALQEKLQSAKQGLSKEKIDLLKEQIAAAKAAKDTSLNDELVRTKIDTMKSLAGIRARTAGQPKPDQSKAATFANRMEQAEAVFSELENKGFDPTSAANAALGSKFVPEIMKPGDVKSLSQAQRNFVNAALRRESGANITKEEQDNANKQYFAQAGDTPEVLAQKAENRRIVREGMVREGGQAYKPYAPQTTPGTKAGITKEYQGKTYEFLGGDQYDPKNWKAR